MRFTTEIDEIRPSRGAIAQHRAARGTVGNTEVDKARPLAPSPRIQAVAAMIAHLSVWLKPVSPTFLASAITSSAPDGAVWPGFDAPGPPEVPP